MTRKAHDFSSLNRANQCTLRNIHKFVHVIPVRKYLVTKGVCDPQSK